MKLRRTLVVEAPLTVLCLAFMANGQLQPPPETRNAALRYWLAFSELKDPPADEVTTDLLQKTATGKAAWDEARLGPILDANSEAIQILQRATKLPNCDWGIEYSQGPRASVAYIPRARVLAQLNTLYGMRQFAKGNPLSAVESWLGGIRFSQHLTQGGSLLSALAARTTLISNLHAMTSVIQSGALNPAQRKRIAATVARLPETGFDWGEVLRCEETALSVTLHQIAESQNPGAYVQRILGRATPTSFKVPTEAETTAFHRLMTSAQEVLRLPPAQAQSRLRVLAVAEKKLHPFFQEIIPSLTRINSARSEVLLARRKLLQPLAEVR